MSECVWCVCACVCMCVCIHACAHVCAYMRASVRAGLSMSILGFVRICVCPCSFRA